jgi:hypothetical protein
MSWNIEKGIPDSKIKMSDFPETRKSGMGTSGGSGGIAFIRFVGNLKSGMIYEKTPRNQH